MNPHATSQEIVQQHQVKASAATTFEALVHRFSAGMTAGPDNPMPLTLEPRPGGRWFRDLGDGAGHLWAFVQSIKPGSLLEMFGPLWMSGPVSNHVIMRFKEEAGVTTITFKHTAFGFIEPSFLEHTEEGWQEMFDEIRRSAEG